MSNLTDGQLADAFFDYQIPHDPDMSARDIIRKSGLSDADLSPADLSDADLTGTTLEDTTVTENQLEAARESD